MSKDEIKELTEEKIKLTYLLLKEQLDFYLIYIRKVDYCIFDKFEYCNKYYVKNLENGDQILFDYAKNMYINKDVNLLASYKEKNIEDNYYYIIDGSITVIYELKNNYSIRYDYYTHHDKRATFCEIEGNLRICNFENKTIYTFSNNFMNNLVKIFHRDLDKEFVYEIIDFYEKSLLKNDEEYMKVGFNQLKKKENEITKDLQDIIDKVEDWTDKGSWGMEKHILLTKSPAMYERILKEKKINFDLEFININTHELSENENTFYKNLSKDLNDIVRIKEIDKTTSENRFARFYEKTNVSIDELLLRKAENNG